MATLRIHVLGSLLVCRGDACVSRFAAARAQQLLGYLCLHRGKLHSRDALAGVLWGDAPEEQARASLRTALWRLRGALDGEGPARGEHLIVARDGIGFDAGGDCWLDLEEFERASQAARGLPALPAPGRGEAIVRLSATVELYRGDLLDGCDEEWCLIERERVRELFLRDLSYLMALHRDDGAYDDAIRCGQRLLRHDPLLEEVHRELMRLHCLAGNRGAAVRQYHACRELLARELDIEPMEETSALHDWIVAGRPPVAAADDSPMPPRSDASTLDETLADLRAAADELDAMRERLRRGVAGIEALRGSVTSADRT